MSFLPSLFLSHIKSKDGLAKPSRFQVFIPIPTYVSQFVNSGLLERLLNLPNTVVSALSGQSDSTGLSRYLTLQCETAELPGKTLQTQDVSIYGPSFKVPYLQQYQDINLGFICTNEFYERKLFDRWLETIIPSDTNNVRFAKGYSHNTNEGYMTNIKIVQYDEFIKQIYAVELQDAFPIGIASQPLSWSDDQFHKLSVVFSYQKYKTLYEGDYDLQALAASLFGGAVAGVPVSKILGSQVDGIKETLNRIF